MPSRGTIVRAQAGLLALAVSLSPLSARAGDIDPPLPPSRWHSWQTGVLRADRLQHASLTFSAGLAGGLATQRVGTVIGIGAVLGIGKELLDMRTTHFDWGDLAADATGAGLAALITRSLER